MQDLQLALVISRLYESEFETASTYKKILQRHVLGQDKQVLLILYSSRQVKLVGLTVVFTGHFTIVVSTFMMHCCNQIARETQLISI